MTETTGAVFPEAESEAVANTKLSCSHRAGRRQSGPSHNHRSVVSAAAYGLGTAAGNRRLQTCLSAYALKQIGEDDRLHEALAPSKGAHISLSQLEPLAIAAPIRKSLMPVSLNASWIVGRDLMEGSRTLWKLER
jgi:hypothetical protein